MLSIHILTVCNPDTNPFPPEGGQNKPTPEPTPEIPAEQLRSIIEIDTRCEWDISVGRIDLFVYGNILREHRVYDCPQDSVWIFAERGEAVRIVAIANAFGSFNEEALRHYDAWGGLELNLREEDPSRPIMGGTCGFTAGEDCRIKISPLMCAIEIRSIEQAPLWDSVLHNPRAWLENAGSRGYLFHDEIQPSKDPAVTQIRQLPYDIGLYTQYPGILMYCYPNETAAGPANPALEVVIEYEKDGTTLQYREEVHPVLRGSRIPLDIVIR